MILKGHDAGVIHVAFSSRGNMIATASRDGTARIWDTSGATLHILRGHTDKVVHVAFDADGRRVATASLDGTMRLWDVSSGKEIAVLPGPDRFVLGVDFNEGAIESDSPARRVANVVSGFLEIPKPYRVRSITAA